MEFEITEDRFFRLANHAVSIANLMPAVKIRPGWEKKDGSPVSGLDFVAENQYIRCIRSEWPGMPILSEESNPRIPNAREYASIDPVDGTRARREGKDTWSSSIAILGGEHETRPIAGLATQPALQRTLAAMPAREDVLEFTDERKWVPFTRQGKWDTWSSIVASDLGPQSPPHYRREVEEVERMLGMTLVSMPAVHAGVEIILGLVPWWWSYTAHQWDVAATALMLWRIGGVAECIDGSPIPWDRVKLPPILLAKSPRHAAEARSILSRINVSERNVATGTTG